MRCPLQRSLPSAILKRHYVTAKTKLPTSNRQRQFPTPCDYLHNKKSSINNQQVAQQGRPPIFHECLAFSVIFLGPFPPTFVSLCQTPNSRTIRLFFCAIHLPRYAEPASFEIGRHQPTKSMFDETTIPTFIHKGTILRLLLPLSCTSSNYKILFDTHPNRGRYHNGA